MTRIPVLLAALALLSTGLSRSAGAQEGSALAVAPASVTVSAASLDASVRLDALPASRVPTGFPAESAVLGSRSGSRHTGTVLMIVGGAGIVTGLLVDESIVTIAGAAVGGYGLYLYLR